MTGIQNMANTASLAVFVLYATGTDSAMRLTEAQYGLLLAGFGAGAVLGSLAAPVLERWLGRSGLLMVAVAVSAARLLTPALTAEPVLIVAAFVLGAALIICWNVVTVSLRQRITPDRLLGRVNAGYRPGQERAAAVPRGHPPASHARRPDGQRLLGV
jgi:predicted MFS family arabinose efflux permease